MAGGLDSGGGGNGRRRFKPKAEINVTPFVDVMLVLLIVFMVSAPLLTIGVPLDLPITFSTPGVSYQFGDFEGAGTILVADPDDAGNTVAQTTKGAGAATFAGTVIGGFGSALDSRIPFSAGNTTLSVRVRAPAAGIPVRLKIENADASVFAELDVNTTAVDAWETLTWDFSTFGGFDPTVDFVRLVIFFDFGTGGDGAVYLWDDVQFVEGT